MPLRLDVKRRLTARSDRVKCCDLHPTEPWMLASLYNGNVHIWNYENQSLIKTFEVCDVPVRACKFISRKSLVVCGSDDMCIRVYNYNTLERVHKFDAHADYIRCIQVHPTQPFILTSSDDMTCRLWNWERNWSLQQSFEGHTHYVMQVAFNPKDCNTFASASLDRTLKVWQLGGGNKSVGANFTLEGHEKGVNCIDYYHGGDKPYLISGADDRLVKIWDYQTKTCVQTLDEHLQNVSAVCFHPELPIIISGSEDGTVKLWHLSTYRLENTINYGLERVWTVAVRSGCNTVAVGYDEGSVLIKMGREEPAISMDASHGKVVWAKHSELQQVNFKQTAGQELGSGTSASSSSGVKDGEPLSVAVKDMGSCEIYPQKIAHNQNGRFVVVCGDGEYIIYTSMALRNKAFGSAQEFVWSSLDSSQYATRESGTLIKVFKNFKEKKSMKSEFGSNQIFGGHLLGVKSPSGLSFYDWETLNLVRRIEVQAIKHVYWSTSCLLAICSEESLFILKFDNETLSQLSSEHQENENEDYDGLESSFEMVTELSSECVSSGQWIGDCFIYVNSTSNRLMYYVGGEIVTVAHLDRPMYILGYVASENRLYLCDKEVQIVSFELLLSVLEYQTVVMRNDFDAADALLPTIPHEQRTRVAHFLEKQGFPKQALAVSVDNEHKFDLAIQLHDIKSAYDLALKLDCERKWRQLASIALTSPNGTLSNTTGQTNFEFASECLMKANDFPGLMLLANASGDRHLLNTLAEKSASMQQNNVTFLAKFISGEVNDCLDILIETHRLPEGAFFARTYVPDRIQEVVDLWKSSVASTAILSGGGSTTPGSSSTQFKCSQHSAMRVSQSLADPDSHAQLFPGYCRDKVRVIQEAVSGSTCSTKKEDSSIQNEVKSRSETENSVDDLENEFDNMGLSLDNVDTSNINLDDAEEFLNCD